MARIIARSEGARNRAKYQQRCDETKRKNQDRISMANGTLTVGWGITLSFSEAGGYKRLKIFKILTRESAILPMMRSNRVASLAPTQQNHDFTCLDKGT